MKRYRYSYNGFASRWVGLVAALILAVASASQAGIVLGAQDWDDDPANNWLQISFPEDVSSEPGFHWAETISMSAGDLYVGAWNTDMWIALDFWAGTTAPSSLQVRFYGDATGTEWGYTLTGPTIGQWTQFTAPLSNWEAWQISPFVDADEFLNDLESINWVGIYIERDGYFDPEIYGIDDFALMVP